MWLRQLGFQGSVALSGSDPSVKQIKQLKEKASRVKIFLDGDEAGRKGARKLFDAILPFVPATIVLVQEGCDPQQMDKTQIEQTLQNTQNPITKRRR
jgi:DNA primase